MPIYFLCEIFSDFVTKKLKIHRYSVTNMHEKLPHKLYLKDEYSLILKRNIVKMSIILPKNTIFGVNITHNEKQESCPISEISKDNGTGRGKYQTSP